MTLTPHKRPPDDEQRLVVLYALQRLAPCTELQLLQVFSEYDWMNYFDMMIALQEARRCAPESARTISTSPRPRARKRCNCSAAACP